MLLIALTGYGQPSERARGREAGFDEHLVKPVKIDDLARLFAGRSGSTRASSKTKEPSGDGEEPELDDETELAG